MKKNVLADNPLDMMFAPRRAPLRSDGEDLRDEPAAKGSSSVVVSIDSNAARSGMHGARPVPVTETQPQHDEAAPEAIAAMQPTERSAVPMAIAATRPTDRSAVPMAIAATQPTERSAVQLSDDESPSQVSSLSRIGTIHKPYLRQRDGVATRQASVTLPVEMLRKVGHCAVDQRMKTSEIIMAALAEYLESRGY